MRSLHLTAGLTAVLLAVTGCSSGSSGSSGPLNTSGSSDHAGTTSSPSAAASTVPAALDASLRALIDAAGRGSGTPAGPVEVVDRATFTKLSHDAPDAGVVGLTAAATLEVKYANDADGVRAALAFADPAAAAADAAKAAAAPLDTGTKRLFTVPGLAGASGYDHVVGGTVVSRDVFFSVGSFELRIGCAQDDHGRPTRRAMVAVARAWAKAAQAITSR